jgi:chromosome segregation ATPase
MNTTDTNKSEKDKTKRIQRRALNNSLYILIPVLLFLMGWSIVRQHNQLERFHRLSDDKSALVMELTNLKADYQMVRSLKEDYEDEMQTQQNRIDQMIREIRFKSDDIEKYQSEISGLQLQLKEYLERVDSLESTLEDKDRRNRKTVARLRRDRDSLAEKIKSASKLNAYNVEIRTLNRREKTTKHPDRVAKVNICLTLGANVFVESGYKNIYLRILQPDESLLYDSPDDLFRANGRELAYTGKVNVNYENVKTRVCIKWKNIQAELEEGLYYVNLYTDGYEIGSRAFLLEKKFLFI